VAAFLGASYFRAVGGDGQYGLSARGLASTGGYRAMFDLKAEDDNPAPIDLRLCLRVDGQPL